MIDNPYDLLRIANVILSLLGLFMFLILKHHFESMYKAERLCVIGTMIVWFAVFTGSVETLAQGAQGGVRVPIYTLGLLLMLQGQYQLHKYLYNERAGR